MIGYLDSSVVLRKILRQSESLPEWSRLKVSYSSRLLRLECLRTLDRMRLASSLTDEQLVECRNRLRQFLSQMGMIPLTEAVLKRAEDPFATPLGTLDGIHLATALLWRETRGDDFVFATHDQELALAAQAHGFNVIGT